MSHQTAQQQQQQVPFSSPNPFKTAFPVATGTNNPFKMESIVIQQVQQPVHYNGFASSINGFQNGNVFGVSYYNSFFPIWNFY